MKILSVKKYFTLIILCFMFFFINSCEKYRKGTLETMELWSTGSVYYNAKFIDISEYSGPIGSIYTNSSNSSMVKKYHYYHTDLSPKKVGYSEGPHTDADGKDMWYHKSGYKNPGENGVWSNGNKATSGSGSLGGGSGGGSGGSGLCSQPYKSPLANPSLDTQLDVFCQAAYAYRCMDGKPLSDPQVKSVCDTYESMKEPGTPKCPYCQ